MCILRYVLPEGRVAMDVCDHDKFTGGTRVVIDLPGDMNDGLFGNIVKKESERTRWVRLDKYGGSGWIYCVVALREV
jgi:hypothetical protein